MGLDVSVVAAPGEIDLEGLYAVREAVEIGFLWYLGDDKEKRAEKWRELKDKCTTITRESLLVNIGGPEGLVQCLRGMSDEKFNEYKSWVVASISDHKDGNTHLSFDYDKLPGRSLMDSCSWNLHGLFKNCEKSRRTLRPCGDFIRELDPRKVRAMSLRWRRKALKMWLAKWIGYFAPQAGYRILGDCLCDLDVEDTCVDFKEVEHYKTAISKVARSIKDGERLWLVASY